MKKVILGVLVAAMAFAVNADAMYWQVSSMNGQKQGFSDDSWSYAQIEVLTKNGDVYESIGDGTYLTIAGTGGAEALDRTAGGAWFDFGNYGADNTSGTEYYFMLELINENEEIQAASKPPMSYSDIVKQGVVVSSFDTIAPLSYTSWNAGTVDLPEPTSGLLMLLGASLLALRRRQA